MLGILNEPLEKVTTGVFLANFYEIHDKFEVSTSFAFHPKKVIEHVGRAKVFLVTVDAAEDRLNLALHEGHSASASRVDQSFHFNSGLNPAFFTTAADDRPSTSSLRPLLISVYDGHHV